MNRMVRGASDGFKYEADQRHADVISRELNLDIQVHVGGHTRDYCEQGGACRIIPGIGRQLEVQV